MKKLLALLLALCMLLTFAACDTDEPNPSNEATDPQTNQPSDPSQPVEVPEDGAKLETELFTLTYDADVWTYDAEDDFYHDEEYAKLLIIVPAEDEGYEINVEIRVSIEDAESFRSYLDSYGFDAYEYAVNNSYDFVTIGGFPCLMQEGNYWGEPCLRYFGRDEAAGATVFVEILGDYNSATTQQLLAGLEFTLTDVGNVDFPWPWDGEPFSAENRTAMLGNIAINSQWIPISAPLVTKETFEHAVAYAAGGNVYILTDGVLKRYTMDGAELVYDSDVAVDGEFDAIQVSNDGSLWLSAFMEPLSCYTDGTLVASYEDTDSVCMAPDGTWGISWFSSNECQKITISGGNMTTQDMIFAEVDTISHLMVDNSYIYVCGSNVDGDHYVFVYNPDGTLAMTLDGDSDWGLGSVTFVAKTATGFMGLDANMRELVFWSADGTYLGSLEDGDVFGTSYPWFCGGAVLPDGSILVIMTEDRADQSAMELVAFQLSGF